MLKLRLIISSVTQTFDVILVLNSIKISFKITNDGMLKISPIKANWISVEGLTSKTLTEYSVFWTTTTTTTTTTVSFKNYYFLNSVSKLNGMFAW
jgi:hypothetical protein